MDNNVLTITIGDGKLNIVETGGLHYWSIGDVTENSIWREISIETYNVLAKQAYTTLTVENSTTDMFKSYQDEHHNKDAIDDVIDVTVE